jgi:tetratricopeptide (TPR) repeat protein/tRNA A-37 threonylcarbamoyl transferase component Bud32
LIEGIEKATGTTLLRGGTIGRYLLLSLIGKGGMGVVYSAYDPELDRKVALKLLRVREHGKGGNLDEKRARLLREAKSMARLSHPNVVTVYDVGTFEDQVFIAMELVDGITVTRWRELVPRTWKEVLEIFMAAGHALAEAHAAGIVHRDFKPDNIMVGRDGKVLVMDFGLARQVVRDADTLPDSVTWDGGAREGDDEEDVAMARVRIRTPVPDPRLTQDGMVVGTPAYMPPEQYLGKSDARTDQFSFCVSLYECLYGEYPFQGKTAFGLTGDAMAGRIREPPPGSRVPPWIRRALLRGLRGNPDERYPSMTALLGVLAKDPAKTRRRWLLAGGLLAAFTAVAVAAHQSADSRLALCAAGPDRVAAAWELPGSRNVVRPRHESVKRAFEASGKSYAQDTVRGVVRILDDYASRWVGQYKEACEATRLHGDQSEEVLDLRMVCLNDRLSGLKALTDVFTDASGEVVERAVDAAHALAPLDRCSDIKQLRALIPPPDPAVKARVDALRRELTSIKALQDAGRDAVALSRLHAVADEARTLGYRPLEAEVMARVGSCHIELKQTRQAEKAFDEALVAALASHHDDLLAQIAETRIWLAGFQGHFDEAARWTRLTEAALERWGRPDSILNAWLLNDSGTILHIQGRYDEALEYYQQSRMLKEKELGPDDPDVAISIANIAITLNALGRRAEALAANERALRIMRLALGSSHPKVADQLNNRGEFLVALGRLPEAFLAYSEAQRIFEHEVGPDDANVAYALTGAGDTLARMGKVREGVQLLERALSIRERLDPEPARLGETMFALARALWSTNNDAERALVLAKRALAQYAQSPLPSDSKKEIVAWLKTRQNRVSAGLDASDAQQKHRLSASE